MMLAACTCSNAQGTQAELLDRKAVVSIDVCIHDMIVNHVTNMILAAYFCSSKRGT